MEELDLKEILVMFYEKKISIAVIIVICLIIGAIYSWFFISPVYTASTTMVLTQSSKETVESEEESDEAESSNTTNSITQSDVSLNQNLLSTYSEIATSSAVVKQVVENLSDLNLSESELKKNISVASVDETEVIEISVVDSDKDNVAIIANELSEVFEQTVSEIYNINNVYVLDEAKAQTTPSNINHVRDLAIAFAIGVVIAGIYVVVINMLDNTVKSKEKVEKELGLPVLVSLFEDEGAKKEAKK